MKTIRSLTESFIYPFLERYTDMVYKGGEDTVFHGIRVLDDDIKFTHGALVNAAATLYVHYVKSGDSRADEVLDRLHYFIKLAASNVCKTWGKLAILRAFAALGDEGLVDRIKPEYVELVKSKTEYDDFFDKEKLETRGMATNYFQVAMACAGYRERLGWENDGYARKIKEKLVGILEQNAINGWLDDELPYGRFDRYSLVLSAEFADTARAAGLSTPVMIRDNLRCAAEAMLFMSNSKGDGVSYGRSVSCHGDATVIEVLAAAFAEGVVKDEERDAAIAYSIKVIEKLLGFWYNEERGCFDMWWGGRGANDYRPIDRILETNLDMVNHLYMALKNYELAGVADIAPSCEPYCPKEWVKYDIDFILREDNVKKTVLMRRGDTLVMLPFVGLGTHFGPRSAYAPFPAVCGVLEASPIAEYPYMIPEYTDANGVKYRPMQYFTRVVTKCENDIASIEAEGYLSIVGRAPKRSEKRFRINYEIKGDVINVCFMTDGDFECAEMVTGANDGGAEITVFGFDTCEQMDTDGRADFNAIHGAIVNAHMNTASQTCELGYTAII